jgi:hypothetical protein
MKEKKQIDWKQAYQNMLRWAKSTGYDSVYFRALAKGQRKLKAPEDTFRIKEKITIRPDGLYAIPDYPTYYATVEGNIWCESAKRKCWIKISQQQLPGGYMQVQLYLDNTKKVIRYVHRLVWTAFNGSIPDDHEIHHVNAINSDNNLTNLECIEKTIHRKMPKPRKNK